MAGQQNADIADTLHLRDIAMATMLWLSMGYNFGCMIASDTLFDSRGRIFGVKVSDDDIANFEVLRDGAMATTFWLSIHGVHRLAPAHPGGRRKRAVKRLWCGGGGIYGVHIGATWRIRLNCPCAAAMQPYVKLL